MKELIAFYKWGVSYRQESAIVYLAFCSVAFVTAFIFLLAVIIFAVSGYPLISGIMILAPICIVGRVSVKKYKAEREGEQ